MNNELMRKCTVHKCADARMHGCTDARMRKCANAGMRQCGNAAMRALWEGRNAKVPVLNATIRTAPRLQSLLRGVVVKER